MCVGGGEVPFMPENERSFKSASQLGPAVLGLLYIDNNGRGAEEGGGGGSTSCCGRYCQEGPAGVSLLIHFIFCSLVFFCRCRGTKRWKGGRGG